MKIIIYEDKERLRQSLVLLLNGMENFEVVGNFSNCSNVKEQITSLKPDVVLMDIDMPEVDGIEGVTQIKTLDTEVKVLMHTVFDDNEKLFKSLQAGADGYLLKKTSPLKLIEGIKEIYEGGAPMSPAIARRVLASFHKKQIPENKYRLTKREKEILQLLTNGYSYKEIAANCFIAMDTVSRHLKNIYTKLHVSCATQAVAKALREKLAK